MGDVIEGFFEVNPKHASRVPRTVIEDLVLDDLHGVLHRQAGAESNHIVCVCPDRLEVASEPIQQGVLRNLPDAGRLGLVGGC